VSALEAKPRFVMADETQLEILKQGVASWNEWRRKGLVHNLVVDLYAADLRGANLSGVHPGGANLRHVCGLPVRRSSMPSPSRT
jgi:hypothetical protein